MKKIISALLVLAMALSLAACGSSSTPTATTAAPAATEAAAAATEAAAAPAGDVKTYKVGVAIYQYNDNFMTLYRQEIENYFKTLETDTVKYEVTMVDGKNDMGEQTNQIDTFITQKMDVIICNLVQTSSAEVIIDKVVAAGIPLVLINREPLGDDGDESYPGIIDNPTVCYVGADARQSGTYQGELILETETQGDINGDGKITYIMCKGDPENIDAQYRTEYSIKALTDADKEVECLYEYLDNWDQTTAQQDVANALAQYGEKIEVVFCNNDAMALGALQSIEQAGRTVGKDIYLVGVDALKEAVQNVVDGKMTGTVLNDDVGQATKAAEATKLFVDGKDVEKYYWVDYVKVTKDNASQYLKED